MVVKDICTWVGASTEVMGTCEDEPICMQITVPVSSHASKKGSQ